MQVLQSRRAPTCTPTTASALKKMFRSDDVIGGDEFRVLMRSIRDTDIVLRKAEDILTVFPPAQVAGHGVLPREETGEKRLFFIHGRGYRRTQGQPDALPADVGGGADRFRP